MATKINKKTANLGIILIIGVIVVLFLIILQKQSLFTKGPGYQNITPEEVLSPTAIPSANEKNYRSEFLKISFVVPPSYSINESGSDITLKNNIGEISVLKNGTNNNSLETYVFSIFDTNKMLLTNKQKIKINQLDTISGIVKFPVSNDPDEKIYYFYPAPWTIYSISTNSQELFADLDKIAQSFRYTP